MFPHQCQWAEEATWEAGSESRPLFLLDRRDQVLLVLAPELELESLPLRSLVLLAAS